MERAFGTAPKDKDAVHPEFRGGGSDLSCVIGLRYAASRDQGIRAIFNRRHEFIGQLSGLVAAKGEAREIISLDPEGGNAKRACGAWTGFQWRWKISQR